MTSTKTTEFSIYDIRCKDLLDDEEIHFGVNELRNDWNFSFNSFRSFWCYGFRYAHTRKKEGFKGFENHQMIDVGIGVIILIIIIGAIVAATRKKSEPQSYKDV